MMLNTLLPTLTLLLTTAMATNIQTKTFTTVDNYTYTYDHVPATGSNSTFLFLHGYPSTRLHWRRQVEALSADGYGIVAPDLLGFGDSSTPVNVREFKFRPQTDHIDALLTHVGVTKVIGVGHDWGSQVLSYVHLFHPDRFEKLAWLSVGYAPSGLDIDGFNAMGLRDRGQMPFGYWYFFNSWDAAPIINDHLDSFFHIIFPDDNSLWVDNFAALAGVRTWLTNDNKTALPSWLTQEDKDQWIAHYSQPNATASSLNIYRSLMRGIQAEYPPVLTEEQMSINVPVLIIPSTQDVVARPEFMHFQTEPWAKAGLTEKPVDAGHWLMLEKTEEVNQILKDFAKGDI
jgi:soluble epoxide hydrolase/lipid-phosphate phosphatase